MKRGSMIIAGVIVLALAGAALWYRSMQQGTTPRADSPPRAVAGPGSQAPSFTLPDINGNTVESSRFLGKPVVINFFATWCPPCRQEIPGFVEVYDKYEDQGFELVGISLDGDTKGNLPQFIAGNRIRYRILRGDAAAARAFGGVSSIPTTFFVGKDGAIRNVHVGYMDRDSFESEVRKLL